MQLNKDFPLALQELKFEKEYDTNIVNTLSGLLVDAVEERIEDEIAIAFSGGIDSTLLAFLAEKLQKKVTLYTIGFKESKDMIAAKAVAKEMDWKLVTKELTIEELEETFRKVIAITKKCDPITVGVGTVTYYVSQMAKEDCIFTGLGSEELFAGYERHQTKDINAACWDGLMNIWERDIKRDQTIANHFERRIKLPFLDKELIQFSLNIPAELKVGERKKQILRDAAINLGLDKDIAYRKKSAAQYGSKIDWAMEKLAKKKGLSKKKYLETLK